MSEKLVDELMKLRNVDDISEEEGKEMLMGFLSTVMEEGLEIEKVKWRALVGVVLEELGKWELRHDDRNGTYRLVKRIDKGVNNRG